MREYEINEDTLALIPRGEERSRALEKNAEYLVEQNTYEVMDCSCQYYGSTYEGRKGGSKKILGSSYKVPIVVKEGSYIIFIPTESPLLPSCTWVSLHNIDYIEKRELGTTIYFKEGKKLNLNVSYGSLENQILRATKLEYILRTRSSEKKKHKI